MARWLARREREGRSWVELSRCSGHPTWKLRWWQRRSERTGRAATTRDRAFVAVRVTEPARGTGSSIEITTPSGDRVRVERDVASGRLEP